MCAHMCMWERKKKKGAWLNYIQKKFTRSPHVLGLTHEFMLHCYAQRQSDYLLLNACVRVCTYRGCGPAWAPLSHNGSWNSLDPAVHLLWTISLKQNGRKRWQVFTYFKRNTKMLQKLEMLKIWAYRYLYGSEIQCRTYIQYSNTHFHKREKSISTSFSENLEIFGLRSSCWFLTKLLTWT